jgi:O-methyltransferase involved in polyketide biosynthesis
VNNGTIYIVYGVSRMTLSNSDQSLQDIYPNAARIYDYTLGGTLNREVDRQAGDYMFSLLPSTPKWVKLLRSFLKEVALELQAEDFDQFLDLGSGLPTQDHVHHSVPNAKVVYVDIDPIAVQHGRELLQDVPNAHYIEGNVHDLKAILNSPTVVETIDLSRKVAIGLNGLTVFFTPEQIRTIAQTLYDWAPEGSQIYITYETKDPDKSTAAWEQFLETFAASGSPMYMLSLEENIKLMHPWRTVRVEPVADYLGMPDGYMTPEDHEGINVQFYAARLTK